MMNLDQLHYSIARIEGQSRGVAFLVEKYDEPRNGCYGLWLTCTHVCGEAGGIQALVSTNKDHYPDFSQPLPLEREHCYAAEDEDIALLYSPEPLPAHLRPLPTHLEWHSAEHEIALYGFPEDSALHGDTEKGARLKSVKGRNNQRHPQITFKEIGVSSGFSGSPIVDLKLGAVVGMVSEVANPDGSGRRGTSAFGIPISFIGQSFKELKLYPLLPITKERFSTQALLTLEEVELVQRLPLQPIEQLSIEQQMQRAELVRRLRDKLLGPALNELERNKCVELFYTVLGNTPLTKEHANTLNALVDDDATAWHQKCMVVSALTLSLIPKLEKTRLRSLLNFLEGGEEQVWQRALVGIIFVLSGWEAEIQTNFPQLARRVKRLQADEGIQRAIGHFYQQYRNINFQLYANKAEQYQTAIDQLSEEEDKKALRSQYGEGDSDFDLYLIFQDFRKNEKFREPHFWFLPFYAGNETALALLQTREGLVPGGAMEKFLCNSITISNSQKYAFCYAYPSLMDFQIHGLQRIFKKEQDELMKLAKSDPMEAESINYSVFRLVLHDLYQFQLFFPQERLAALIDFQLQLPRQSLPKLLLQEKTRLRLESEKYLDLGNALDDQGNYAQAVQAYQKAIELQPDYATAYYNLGRSFYHQGEYAQAVQAYQKAIELQPDYVKAYNNLGIALDDLGEYAQAIQAYQKAIELQPDYAKAYNSLGCTYLAQGQLQQAQATYEQAFQIDKNHEYLHMNYAHCLLAQNNQEQAMAHYRRSREGFGDKASFFKGMADDYTDFRLGQYGMEEKAYFAVIEELENEIKYTE